MIAIEMSGDFKSSRFVDNWRKVRLIVDHAKAELRKLGYREFYETSESSEFRQWIAESCTGGRVLIAASPDTPKGVRI